MALTKKPYKGCRDFHPLDMRIRDYIFNQMKKATHDFAFEAYDGPLLEEVDLYLAKSGEELITDQIYSFTDRGDRKVAIRPEMTPTLARMVAGVHREISKPIRWYSIPNVMRYEKPQRGRLREHWQLNADVFGAEEHLGEIEVLSLMDHLMRKLGADTSMYGILLNDRRVVDAIFNNLLNLESEASYKLYKVIDKAKKVNTEALDKMISEIIIDESQKLIFKNYLSLDSFDKLFQFLEEHKISEVSSGFSNFIKKVKNLPVYESLIYDPTIVRGLDYYTGIVFEVFDKHPDNRRAIAGGGAYANLLQIFNEKPLAGVGFGMGDVTLRDFLETHKLLPDLTNAQNDLIITYFEQECEETAFKLASDLRVQDLKVELALGVTKFNKAFKIAQSKGHTHIAMIGSNELSDGVVQIKNLVTRDGKNIEIKNIQEIKKYIKGL
jgi:histidyl-tRNA synthetase